MTRQQTRIVAAIVAVTATVTPAAAAAQTPGATDRVTLALEDAIARGLAASHRVREVQSRQSVTAATRDARSALDRPVVSASSSYVRTNHVEEFGVPQAGGATRILFPDIPDTYRLRADIVWPVWTGGRVNALVSSAEAEMRAVNADGSAVADDVTFEIAQAYWALVTAHETVGVLDQGLQRTDAWVGDVQARLDAGLVSPHEVLTAKAQRARQQVQRIQAAHAASAAERELARLVGIPGRGIDPVSPVGRSDDVIAALAALPVAEVVARARDARAERGAFAERQSAFRAAADAAMAARRPQVTAIAALEPSRPNNRFVPRQDEWQTSWDLGINVTWALWDGGRARADRAIAQAQAHVLGHRLAEFDDRVAVDVQVRLSDLEAGRAAIAASDEAVSAATEAFRVLQERYASGVATSTEVLDAQVAVLEASLERTRLQAALRISEARLRRTVGVR
jgi:outer membrane protein TolC